MADTTFADGAGEKPSMVRAPIASSLTSLFMAVAAAAPAAGIWSAIPSTAILSLRSTMMRCAVRSPIPFTVFSIFSLPEEMTLHSSAGDMAERIMRAVLAPTPDTVMRSRNISRSCLVENPKRAYASSRMLSTTYSFTSFLFCMPL